MGFLERLLGRTKKTIVIALDGVPYSFIRKRYEEGDLKHLGAPEYRQMTSVYPTISSVAWSSFMTGKNPGKHNIFGFMDRKPGEDGYYIPDSQDVKGQTLWDYLTEKKKKSFVMNVPMTYPPIEINGKMVSGFLCSSLEKGTYPRDFSNELKKMGYRIDADSSLALENLDKFLDDLNETFEARSRALFRYIEQDWDLFMVQFMGTDRINHFMMGHWAEGDDYADEFLDYYKKVDKMIGKVKKKISEDENLIIMSDHGFTPLQKEVQINYWLKEAGYLEDTKEYDNITRESDAFSLLPGRFYINLEGREGNGGVEKEKYSKLKKELKKKIENLRDPMSGEPIIDRVFEREEIYHGPYTEKAADLIAHPKRGYDLKGDFDADEFVSRGLRNGMHTYSDAFLYSNRELKDKKPNIIDLFPTILDMMKVKKPKGLDGTSLV